MKKYLKAVKVTRTIVTLQFRVIEAETDLKAQLSNDRGTVLEEVLISNDATSPVSVPLYDYEEAIKPIFYPMRELGLSWKEIMISNVKNGWYNRSNSL